MICGVGAVCVVTGMLEGEWGAGWRCRFAAAKNHHTAICIMAEEAICARAAAGEVPLWVISECCDSDPVWFKNFCWMLYPDPPPTYGEALDVILTFQPAINRWMDSHVVSENQRSRYICERVMARLDWLDTRQLRGDHVLSPITRRLRGVIR